MGYVICAGERVQVACPGPSRSHARRVGALTEPQQQHPMAFKWTKASRTKLSRSQKADGRDGKRQQRWKRS